MQGNHDTRQLMEFEFNTGPHAHHEFGTYIVSFIDNDTDTDDERNVLRIFRQHWEPLGWLRCGRYYILGQTGLTEKIYWFVWAQAPDHVQEYAITHGAYRENKNQRYLDPEPPTWIRELM